jgi:CheY-like chemotaxis protein
MTADSLCSYPEVVALRCLIVDDNPGFLQAARGRLEQEGFRVVGVASTTAEAVQRVAEHHPDVTLIDIDLGEESGFDAARLLAYTPRLDPGQLILMSSHAEDDFVDLIEESPAVGFLAKPALSSLTINGLLRAAASGDDQSGQTFRR